MKRPAQMTPAAEKLRLVLKNIYRPADRREFDEQGIVMGDTYYTASAAAREVDRSVMTVLRAVHKGLIHPSRTTTGGVLFTRSQVETLRLHLTKPKP
jgi:hypothetical protein